MEAVGAAASVMQLISFTGEVLAIGYGYLAKVRNAPIELKSLLHETASIDVLLEQIQVLAVEVAKPLGTQALQKLDELGILDDCATLMKIVRTSVQSCEQVSK